MRLSTTRVPTEGGKEENGAASAAAAASFSSININGGTSRSASRSKSVPTRSRKAPARPCIELETPRGTGPLGDGMGKWFFAPPKFNTPNLFKRFEFHNF